jgi:hypothetical protein
MRIRASAASLVALAVSSTAQAQARVEVQLSPANAETWSSFLAVPPSASVDVRVRVSYTGFEQPLGLASLYMQPTVSSWVPTGPFADTLAPFVSEGGNSTTPSGAVPDAPGQFGRIRPFASRPLYGSERLTSFVHTPSISYLRICQFGATDWVGTGSNTTGLRGIPITQFNDSGRLALEPPFSPQLQNIVVFKFRLSIGPWQGARSMNVAVPLEGFQLNTVTNSREVRWYRRMDEPTPSLYGLPTIVNATLFVPNPATSALLLIAAGLTSRRHRP